MKYGLIGLLLLGGAVGLWFAMQEEEPEKPVEEVAEPKEESPERSTALAQSDFVIPEGEEDAGAEVEEEPEPQRRVVRRAACDGKIDPAKAMAVVNQHRRQVRNCYERRLKVNNILQGSMSVQLRIGSSGEVKSVRIGGSLRDNEVYSCVRQLASKWTFPAPEGGRCAVLAVPFSFTPRE